MGLDVYFFDKTLPGGPFAAERKMVDINDPVYPEHMFKLNYMRSSYNAGGINRVLKEAGLSDLYELFGYDPNGGTDNDTYPNSPEDIEKYNEEATHPCFTPDWDATKQRVLTALEALRNQSALVRSYFVDVLGRSHKEEDFKQVFPDAAAAVALYKQKQAEKAAQPAGFDSFSCSSGEFMLKGMTINAVIPGREETLAMFTGVKVGVHVIYTQAAEDRAWYTQALEIVARACDYGKEHNLSSYWSG